MASAINLIAMPRLDPRRHIRATAPFGSAVSALVSAVLPGATPDMVRVTIGDQVISPEHWSRVRPKEGAVVIIRALPRGDRDLLRSVLLIAVTIAAVAVGQLWLGPTLAASLGYAAGTAGANFVAGVTSSVLALGGTMLVNALIPPRPPLSESAPSPTYSIQGWKNVANPNGIIPSVLGKHRMAPPFAALPYSEISGEDQYITAMFCFGYGPVAITNLRIGETPIGDYQDVFHEIREGYPGDAPLTLYPEQVLEEALSVTLTQADGPSKRYTASDVVGVSIDLAFPGGLVAIRTADKKSRQLPMTVVFNLRQRLVGTDTWQVLAPIEITGAQAGKTLRRTIRWNFPVRGRWEIELNRVTDDFDDQDQTNAPIQIVSRSAWTAIRAYRPEYPLDFPTPLALAAVRIRATDQLNGSLDEFNADVAVICRDWNYLTQAWEVRQTQNPAALFRHVLQGPAMTYPLADDEVGALEEWHDFCRVRGLTYNRVHDYEASVLDVLSDIAAAGRASPHDTGTAWGVVIDRAMTLIEGHISARNSWGFAGERVYSERPDAFRVSFLDETNGFQNAERVVPFPDFEGDPVVTEALNLPGITHPDLVWKEARRRQYEVMKRPDTYTINQDFEHIVHMRGSLVRLSHDVLDRTQVSARVKSVDGDIVTLDELVTMEAGQSYACRFRKADGQSLLRTVQTAAGESSKIRLTGPGDMPAAGDLAMFGRSARETSEVIVKGIEVSDNLTGRLNLVDHAPEIEALTDAEVPPPWDGRAGGEIIVVDDAPPVPVIVSIKSSQETGGDEDSILVMLAPGAGAITTASYELRHRLAGAPGWTVEPVSASAANASLTGYASGDELEVEARALSYSGAASDYCATQSHVIGSNDTLVPPIASFSAIHSGEQWRYDWEIGEVEPGREAVEIEGVRIAAKLGLWGSYTDLDAIHSGNLISSPYLSPIPASDEIQTIGIAAFTESGRRGPTTLITAGTWRNLLEHSDDPDGWITPVRVDVASGALVGDPLGGNAGRALTFAADSGRIYAEATIAGALAGRTFTASVYVRAPAGKARIVVAANSDTQFLLQDIALTGAWQRITQTLTCAGGDTVVRLAIENRTAAGASDPAAGVVEVFGGVVEEAAVASTYQHRP